MKRKIYKDLLNWKENSIDIPLMIIGARQIGKTYIIKEFCKNEFENYIKSMSLNDIIIKLSGTHDYVEFVDNEW